MKWKLMFFFSMYAMGICASEENCLTGASGCVAVTAVHIQGLDSWQEPQEAYIGSNEHISQKEFVAERECGRR